MRTRTKRDAVKEYLTPTVVCLFLKSLGIRARLDSQFRRHLANGSGAFNGTFLLKTRDDKVKIRCLIRDGRIRAGWGGVADPDVTMIFRDRAAMSRAIFGLPQDTLMMLLKNDLMFEGNLTYVARFTYLLNKVSNSSRKACSPGNEFLRESKLAPPVRPLAAEPSDAVRHLTDTSLSDWSVADFPRLERCLKNLFETMPQMSAERPRLMTEYFKREGFETDRQGRPRNPVTRQAEAFNYLMENRKPVIWPTDLIAGTTSEHPVGVVLYPELGGTLIWPELDNVHTRKLNPYGIDPEDARLLDQDVFPYWQDRNLREFARTKHNNPLCMKLDERQSLYFQWKVHALSHTIPDLPTVLSRGMEDIARQARERASGCEEAERREFYEAMALTLEGVMAYAENLAQEAERLAEKEGDETRRQELAEMARICRKVPARPADTLHEALNSIWIAWVAIHMENTNAGMSVGRLDKWLQPYFLADVERLESDQARREYLKRAVELTGCFLIRFNDHVPLIADLGNYLFGGSSSNQALTIGGVNEDGSTTVNDMTYVILKVYEMLRLRDPNLNARWHPEANSAAYLQRLCEINMITGSTPSIHNDQAVIRAMEQHGFPTQHARDWSATGCVEPTSSGRHLGHTNCMLFNLVAALEMALHNGYHPLLDETVGPKTGAPSGHADFESFYAAYIKQVEFLADKATECNNLLGRCHQYVRPTPFLSSVFQGPMDKGMDVTHGGAVYNSSGAALIGLSDIVDSLISVKHLVYDEGLVTLAELVDALKADYAGREALLARTQHKLPKFGGDDPEVAELAARLVQDHYRIFQQHENYRGGRYMAGYWSMSNHVAFGRLSGALPSGRRAGEPFTPGLTPSPESRDDLATQIRNIAALDPTKMPNNIAFNVKVAPSPRDTHAQTLAYVTAYAKTYFEAGGMQMQFNVMSSETLKKAKENPGEYRNLMVRISGYNAYFVELNEDLQNELIRRAEHRLGA